MQELRQVFFSLYDNDKLKQPKVNGKEATFDEVDNTVLKALADAQASNKKVVLLSHSMPSPTFKKLLVTSKLNILMLS